METVYCPSCRASIPADAVQCPTCGAAASTKLRLQESHAQAAAMARVATGRPDIDLAHLDAKAKEKYLRNLGNGMCLQCRSQNVKRASISEGGSRFWYMFNMFSALFWFFVSGPISCFLLGPGAGFLLGLVPFFISGLFAILTRPKGIAGNECNYCGHRWRI